MRFSIIFVKLKTYFRKLGLRTRKAILTQLDNLPSSEFESAENREAPRIIVSLDAKLLLVDQTCTTLSCRILDISSHGIKIEISAPVQLPETVLIQLNNETNYEIRHVWSYNNRMGFTFLHPVELDFLHE